MSKQSSIDWLIDQVEDYIGLIPFDIIQQAKQMHKEEIIEFGNDCLEYMVTDWKAEKTVGEEYYQETYGGNNE